jgi:purine-binding chemotaxis protein CheW
MTAHTAGIVERALMMRRDFDRAFAVPMRSDETAKEDFLAIRCGSEPCAIRLSQVAGLYADKKITAVPGGQPTLRGIAGFRGNILPVYDLPMLLGFSLAPTSRWLAVVRSRPFALAFDAFDGQVRATNGAIMPRRASVTLPDCAGQFLQVPGFAAPIIDLPSVIDAINKRV